MKNESLKRTAERAGEVIGKAGKKLAALKGKIGPRTIAAACAVILVGCAVVLNIVLFRDGGATDGEEKQMAIDLSGITDADVGGDTVEAGADVKEEQSADDYFATVSLGRQQARDEAMEVLLEVSENEGAEIGAREAALADISRMALDIERESNIEAMVVAKGFEKCVAVISGDRANVIVSCDTLTPGETAQISEIVYEASGIVPANLTIIEKSIKG